MPLRADPLQELLDLQERINRIFEDTLTRDRLEEPKAPHGSWVPSADVFETVDGYVVELELPGVAEQDVTVHAHDDELVVRGERQAFPAGRPESFHRLERRHGSFGRSFRFPGRIEATTIEARLVDGVLRVRVPKPREQGTRRVPVERPGEP